jgi:hypothetical protein
VKEVNSKEKETTGVSSSVHIRLDKWEGWANFIVMPMDDFEVILGKEFLRRMHSVLMPWMDKMVILGEQKAWVVCTTCKEVWWKGATCVCIEYEERNKVEWITYLCNNCWRSSRGWSGDACST